MSISVDELLNDFSVEITGKDAESFTEASSLLPPGTKVNVTFLGNENLEMRRSTAAAVKDAGRFPVPHISARRITSEQELEEFLKALQDTGTGEHIFTIAGDPVKPLGPYQDSLELITRAPFDRYGVQRVSIAGYPEGHPDIADEVLWAALRAKAEVLEAQGRGADIVTQFGFDVDPVLAWIEQVRQHGITLPVRVGVPGPAGVKRLLNYARRFGVASSASIAKKYGLSLANLVSTAGPDRFLADLAAGLNPAVHGQVRIHFYTFGGLKNTAEWVQNFADTTPTT